MQLHWKSLAIFVLAACTTNVQGDDDFQDDNAAAGKQITSLQVICDDARVYSVAINWDGGGFLHGSAPKGLSTSDKKMILQRGDYIDFFEVSVDKGLVTYLDLKSNHGQEIESSTSDKYAFNKKPYNAGVNQQLGGFNGTQHDNDLTSLNPVWVSL